MKPGESISATLSHQQAAARFWDAVVIGAGPAGSMAARALAMHGRSVLLVDKACFPRDKVCGCCLSGAALDTLKQAGLASLISSLRALPLDTVEIRSGTAHAVLPSRGLCVSRSRLDAALIREAIAQGAAFLPATTARVSERGVLLGVSVDPPAVQATTILVSDGLCGTALVIDPPQVEDRARIGLSTIIPGAFPDGRVVLACDGHGYVGAVRLETGLLNIAAALDPAFLRARGSPGAAVSAILLRSGLDYPAELISARWHGTGALTRTRHTLFRPGLVVLGDAAGYVEPFTGEGIGWALASGQECGDLVAQGNAHLWPALHRRLIGRRQRLCRAIAAILRRPRLARAAVRAAGLLPLAAHLPVSRVHRPLLGAAR